MLDDILASLRLVPLGDHRFQAPHAPDTRGVVFGGQMLAQAIVAAHATQPAKRVKSVQTVFAKGLSTEAPVEISCETIHEGRNLGSMSITFEQGGRTCAAVLALMDVAEPDLVRFQGPQMPDVPPPDPATVRAIPHAAPEGAIVGDVDIMDPDAVGPASLRIWVRFPGAPDDGTTARALLSYATDGWLIATAMRPHPGVGQSMAHASISTGVVSHALAFHDDLDARDWHLIDHSTIFSGGGRTYGQGNVFTSDGRLVATFVQESLLRHFPQGQDPTGKQRTIF